MRRMRRKKKEKIIDRTKDLGCRDLKNHVLRVGSNPGAQKVPLSPCILADTTTMFKMLTPWNAH